MKIIEIIGKKFKLASRTARMFALTLDIFVSFLISILGVTIISFLFDFRGWSMAGVNIIFWTFWIACLLSIDGIKNGQGFGKRALSLQVLRLEDGKPCTFKDSIVRRITGIFQPFDLIFSLGKNRQRIGDKFANTVVVNYEPYLEEVATEPEKEDPEKVLNEVIVNLTQQLSKARQKVDASIGIERQFQDAYEDAKFQAERCEERASIAIQAGRDDLAREDITKRNELQQLANNYKIQWIEQKQVVNELKALLDTLQKKTDEVKRKRDVIIAQNRNVDAQQHLQKTLTEVQDSAVSEILNELQQNANEAAILANAATDADIELKNLMLNKEFESYAEEASIENDLAELKTKLQQ